MKHLNLYKAITEIKSGNKIVDRIETNFGIRSIRFDAANGFTLNGKRVILKGGCIHHDNGPLGAAAIDRAEERKIELLKKAGYNAIRISHNPPSKQLLDACDRLVCWSLTKHLICGNSRKIHRIIICILKIGGKKI